ncbi:HAD-IA family hydrolase [Rhizobium sp. BK251]|uniref:HAD-IA family hydrolase n=1 Tax=Rhizobium sp. BK251 TaxID=2512125 RepID=UPI00104E5DB9|nr:HAD-IA family hydrolase [Rhizobium sp. BK251]TCL64096.1 sugar-phosphatase [Rhizobium sp. BK251]
MPELFTSTFDAFLFDMDGTILNSIAVAERVWGAWAWKFGLNPEVFLPTIHGRRAAETISSLGLPGVDAEAEAAAITKAEIDAVRGVVPISGASRFLRQIPPSRWAVVTSAPAVLARRRIEVAGLPMPATIVTAEDVSCGKPAPDCFLLAAERLSVDPARCLVFEDAEAGITAAAAAGCQVVVVAETHKHRLAGSHRQISNYERIRPRIVDGGLGLSQL